MTVAELRFLLAKTTADPYSEVKVWNDDRTDLRDLDALWFLYPRGVIIMDVES